MAGDVFHGGDAFLQGTAYFANEVPKANAAIWLRSSADGFTSTLTTVTDSNGHYHFDGLVRGETYHIIEPSTVGYHSEDTQILSQVYEATEISANTIAVNIPSADQDLWLTYIDFARPNLPPPPNLNNNVENISYSLFGGPSKLTSAAQLRDKLGTSQFGDDINHEFQSLCVALNAPVSAGQSFEVIAKSSNSITNGVTSSPISAERSGRIAYLFNHYGSVLLTQNAGGLTQNGFPGTSVNSPGPQLAAGLQLAVWELIYDQIGPSDLDSGDFKILGIGNGNTTNAELLEMKNAAMSFINDSIGKSELAIFLDPSTITQTPQGQGMLALGSYDFINATNSPITPIAKIVVSPDDVNRVGDPHTFTATVMVDDGYPAGVLGADDANGYRPATNEEITNLTISLNGTDGAVPSPTGAASGDNNLPLTFTSASAGVVLGHATATLTVTVGGIQYPLSVETDGATDNVSTPSSQDAVKTFVDASISIAANATNEVGDEHTFTATVLQNSGTGGFVNVPDGTQVTFTIVDTHGTIATGDDTTTTTIKTTTGGNASVTVNSATATVLTVNAATTLTVGGLQLTRDTDVTSDAAAGPAGSEGAGAAKKTYIDAKISIGVDGNNRVGDPHTFTTVFWVDYGDGVDSDNDGSTFDPVEGAAINVTLANSGDANAIPSGSLNGLTDGSGQFAVTFTSATPGTTTGTATGSLTIDGVTLTRTTNGSETSVGSGETNSDSAVKTWYKPGIEIIKKTNGEDANTAAGAPVIAPGAPVTWTYEVKNTSVGWSYTTNDIVIVDDAGTPSDTSDDFSTPPSPTALTITRDVSSDVGSDGILSPGETWIYSASSVAQALPSTPGSSSTIDLTMNTTTTNTTGNIRTMSAGGVSVHASAFSRTKGTNGTWAAGYLGSYSGGLGVTDTSEDGSNPGHTVDNVGRDNYVLFEFDQSVVVDQAFLGYVVNDSDLRVWIGNIPNAYSSHQTLSDSVLSGLGFTELNETTLTTTRWADFNNGNVSGNILVIAASPDDTTPEDNFKIKKLTIGQPGTPGCYENYAQVTTPFDDVTATDLSHYCNPPAQTPLPKIDIEKTTTGTPNANSTAPTYDNEDTPNGAGVPILTPGTTVTWTYQVTNTGNVPFAKADVVVKDDNGTASTGDDFTPVYVSGDVLPNGSVGIDNILSPGEVWIYQASGTVKTLSSATGSSATFDFSGSSYTDGTDGNVRSYSASGVAVKASAWSRVKGPEISTSWAPAYLGAYGGGLGVTDSSEGDGSSNLHTVDNVGRDNYVLFEFDQMVAIDSAFLGYVVDDSDLRVWIGTKTNPYSNHQSLNDAFLASMGFTEDNLTDLTTTRLADLNSGNYVGNVVIIAANPGDDTPEDRFKIEKVTVKTTEAGVYANKGTVTATASGNPTVTDSDLSHYKNPIAPPTPTTGSISGYVYKDCDNDACRESGESGLKDVTVKLYDSAGALVATAKTASDGSYKFANLPAGTYKLVETQPSAYFDGKEKAGSLGGNTSVNDQISNIMLTAGTNAYDYNFAELYGGSLSGYVYKDSDNDGRKDYGEGGIQGVKILLTGTDILGRSVSRYVYTDCNGYYLFDNLYAGTYTISEVDPSYYADGKDTLGNLGGCLLNDKFTNIKVGFCDEGLNYNFGERSSSGC